MLYSTSESYCNYPQVYIYIHNYIHYITLHIIDIERYKDIFYPFQDANPNDAPGMLWGHNYAMEPFSTIGAERVGPPWWESPQKIPLGSVISPVCFGLPMLSHSTSRVASPEKLIKTGGTSRLFQWPWDRGPKRDGKDGPVTFSKAVRGPGGTGRPGYSGEWPSSWAGEPRLPVPPCAMSGARRNAWSMGISEP